MTATAVWLNARRLENEQALAASEEENRRLAQKLEKNQQELATSEEENRRLGQELEKKQKELGTSQAEISRLQQLLPPVPDPSTTASQRRPPCAKFIKTNCLKPAPPRR